MFYVYIVIAYLLGSISTSTILGRLVGVDIKKEGSGNAGTTNALRVLGKKAALITLVCDVAKGVLAVGLGRLESPTCAYLCALAVVVGHVFPVFFKFKGGKGVATALGAVLMINWKVALVCLAVALILTLASKRMSVGSLGAAVCIIASSALLEPGFLLCAIAMAVLVIFKHGSNIQRLIKGEEPTIGFLDRKRSKDEN